MRFHVTVQAEFAPKSAELVPARLITANGFVTFCAAKSRFDAVLHGDIAFAAERRVQGMDQLHVRERLATVTNTGHGKQRGSWQRPGGLRPLPPLSSRR